VCGPAVTCPFTGLTLAVATRHPLYIAIGCYRDSDREAGEGRRARRVPSLKVANGRLRVGAAQSEEEIRSPPPQPRLAKDDSIKISIENTNTCTDSLVTAIDDEALLIADYLSNSLTNMNYKESGKVHFGGDDVSLYGTPKEEPGPNPLGTSEKQSFIKNQLQALFQPTDNKLAMKLFGSKKALMKERIRQKAAGHWVIHPCSSFRSVIFFCMFCINYLSRFPLYTHAQYAVKINYVVL